MNNNNPFDSIKLPELHKLTIPSIDIDKDKIPQEKVTISKEQEVEWAKDLILRATNNTYLLEEGEKDPSIEMKEKLDKMTDDEVLEIAEKVGEHIHKMVQRRKEEEATFSMKAETELHEEDGETIVNPTKVISFSPVDIDAKLLPPIIKERLSAELGIGEIPDDLETQVHLCKTWLRSKEFFALPVERMYDWQVILLTTSALSCPDDKLEMYHNLASMTTKDVEEASKDYETMLNNFNTVFGKPD